MCRAFETNYLRPLRAIRPIGEPSRNRLPAKDQRQAQRRQRGGSAEFAQIFL